MSSEYCQQAAPFAIQTSRIFTHEWYTYNPGATSALDSANERDIQAELQSVAQNKITLVIANRLSTVVDGHEILVMEAGRIIERGSMRSCWRSMGGMRRCGRCSSRRSASGG